MKFQTGKYRFVNPFVSTTVLFAPTTNGPNPANMGIAGPQQIGFTSYSFKRGDVVNVLRSGYNDRDQSTTVAVEFKGPDNQPFRTDGINLNLLEKVADSTEVSNVEFRNKLNDPANVQDNSWMLGDRTKINNGQPSKSSMIDRAKEGIGKYWTNVLTVVGVAAVLYFGYQIIKAQPK